jgi:GxxExxY protein
LIIELGLRGLSVQRQTSFAIDYKGQAIGSARLDLIVDDALVVELKVVEAIHPLHRAQLRSYLKTGSFQLGLLINFNVPVLRDGIHRVILTG